MTGSPLSAGHRISADFRAFAWEWQRRLCWRPVFNISSQKKITMLVQLKAFTRSDLFWTVTLLQQARISLSSNCLSRLNAWFLGGDVRAIFL